VNAIRIVEETENTVTVRREDWLGLLAALEDAEDRAAVNERKTKERLLGKNLVRDNYLTADEAMRLLDGASPLRVWREKRGFSQRSLAEAVGIASSYLAEMETGRKGGSDDVYRRLGGCLRVPPEDLRDWRYRSRDPNYGPVILHIPPANVGVAPGQRAASIEQKRIVTVGAALRYVSREWARLRNRAPWITDTEQRPIFDVEELFLDMEAERLQ
jgi:transcriptional regulator with XRE-family HTH domain